MTLSFEAECSVHRTFHQPSQWIGKSDPSERYQPRVREGSHQRFGRGRQGGIGEIGGSKIGGILRHDKEATREQKQVQFHVRQGPRLVCSLGVIIPASRRTGNVHLERRHRGNSQIRMDPEHLEL